jgi:hypothetical protein
MDTRRKRPTKDIFGVLVLAAAMPLLAGCGGKLVPVRGIVRLDKKPLEKAGVMFHAVDKGPVASGTTDAQGRFELFTVNDRGALPGKYKVTVSVVNVVSGMTEEAVLQSGQRIVHVTPEVYGDPKTTPLTATVQRGAAPFEFDLSSKVDAEKKVDAAKP